jgi:PAS domain S-box-containing protein
MRILYVYNSDHERKLVRHALELESGSFQIIEAGSRHEFEALLALGNYDLILSEASGGGSDSLQVLDIVKERASPIPVVIITGTGSRKLAQEAMKRGAADYVLKSPRQIYKLPGTLRRVLEEQRLRTEIERAREAIRASEERYTSLFQTAREAILRIDGEGTVLAANPAAAGLLGYKNPEVMIGTPFPVDVTAFDIDNTYDQLLENGYVTKDPVLLIKQGGSGDESYVRGSAILHQDENGQDEYINVLLSDVTEHVLLNRQLAENQRRLKALFDNALDGIIITNDAGEFIDANPAACKLLGYSQAELQHLSAWELLPEESSSQSRQNWQSLLASGALSSETQALRKDGKPLVIEFHAVTNFLPGMHLAIFRDISEAKLQQQTLLESKTLLEDTFASLDDALFVVNPSDRIILNCNIAVERIFGYSPDELIGKNTRMLFIDSKSYLRYGKAARLALTKTGSYHTEVPVRRKDGRAFLAELSASRIGEAPGWTGDAVVLLRDITEKKRCEQALRESEARFSTIFNSSPIGIVLTRLADGKIIDVNQAFLSLLGFTRREVIGHTTLEPNMWATQEERGRIVERLREQGGISNVELKYRRKSGETGDSLTSSELIRIGDEQYMLSLINDITQRKQVEEALIASENKLRLITDALPALINYIDADQRYRFTNRAYEDWFGVTSDEVYGKRLEEVLGTPAYQVISRYVDQVLTGQAVNYDTWMPYKDGRARYVHASYIPDIGANGQVQGYYALINDISELKRGDQALRESEERFRRALENIPDVVVIYDRELRIQYINSATRRITGRSPSDFIGRRDDEIWPPEVYQVYLPTLQRALESRKVCSLETDLILPEGGERSLQITCVPLVDEAGEVREVLGITHDLTEIKQSEDKLQQLYESERQQRQLAEALRDVSAALNATLDVDAILERLLENVGRAIPFDLSYILRIDGKVARLTHSRAFGNSVDYEAAHDSPSLTLEVEQTEYLRRLVAGGVPEMIPDLSAIPGWPYLPGRNDGCAWLGAPILVGKKTVAIFSLLKMQASFFQPEHVDILTAFTSQAALALQNAKLFEDVRRSRERLYRMSRQLVEIQEKERRTIARELHDEIGQVLTGLKLLLGMSAGQPVKQVRANLREAESLANALLQRVREMSLDLRPAMLDDLGILPALLWLFERYTKQTGIRVEFNHQGIIDCRFAPDLETGMYRIIQEALTNAARHARVKQVQVGVWVQEGAIVLEVVDQGKGFDIDNVLNSTSSSGLHGIAERIELLGGKLTISSAPGEGTHLQATLPLHGRIERRSHERIHPAG